MFLFLRYSLVPEKNHDSKRAYTRRAGVGVLSAEPEKLQRIQTESRTCNSLVARTRSLLPSQLYLDHSHCPVLAPATLAALPFTRAIPDRDVFYVAHPVAPFTFGLKASSVVVIDRRRRQCRGLSRGAGLRPHRASAGSIEIFPAARARGVTIPGLRRCCMK